MKKIISAILLLCVFGSCTKNFESLNQDENQISKEELLQDNNLIGAPFKSMLFNLFGHQIEEDLCYDSWMGYMNTPTDFVGNVNNTTYYIRWNTYWDRVYNNVMSPSKKAIEYAVEYNKPIFADWAKLIQILSVSKLTAVHGPVIYSNYGSTENSILYDKESDLYNMFFAKLDTIQADFAANQSDKQFKAFDPSYAGSIPQWMKVVNSLRLRLAMRLSKVAPDLAKTQGEKALNDPGGLILDNKDNFKVALLGNIMPVAQICYQWDDTRMGGVIESFMAGYKDERASKMFEPAASISPAVLPPDPNHPSYPYKGIRNGAYCGTTKPFMLQYSKVSNDFNSVQNRRAITASEVSFLKAEAALRGWAGAGDAKENYENGVRLSFADWGAGGVDAYLADNTSKPLNYVDPADSRNNFTQPSTVTIAWNEADSKELKLEKILTQKYLNTFTNTLEAWVDFRRTGYPKIPHVAKNDSSPDWGVIPSDQWIKRMPFVTAERNSNTAAVADAVTKMGSGAKDDIATRLWWDTGGPNF
ncbi:SusD/RagB family nutrient-binding outer membrane lipoprotein [Terrimonas sp.]|uniref:SusD/RagB family nutrient-binding outer membrane lipoprotein n=1 Tax=Terrimonas sp. TaxID=1914338 RepID=UPI000D5109DF|nr:SusD/RagB family nutrient-binding outer membrane lipoprotein [Terrimonas sp.]PVD52122.1 SusD/RagB family nutrient-binding outer membrane lipoprotein [Terrimonas sp.]